MNHSRNWKLGLAGALAFALVLLVAPSPRPPPPLPSPLEAPVPLQEWTTADAGDALRWVVLGSLPPPDPRQRKPPCRTSIGERAVNGLCWLKLAVPLPCPEGEAWEYEGACYAYALEAKPIPKSGGSDAARGMADP